MSADRPGLRPSLSDGLILIAIVAACCTWQGLVLLGLLTYVAFPLFWMLSRSRAIQVGGPKSLADRLGPWIALVVVLNWMFLFPSIFLELWPRSWQSWPVVVLGLALGSLPCLLLPVWFLLHRIEDRQRPDPPAPDSEGEPGSGPEAGSDAVLESSAVPPPFAPEATG